MDETMKQLLKAFHVLANKGSLHKTDKHRLFDFIVHAADSIYMTDEITDSAFKYLTGVENKPWPEDLARELMRDIRFGIQILPYSAGREE